MELIEQLMNELGVQQNQAEGGIGLLLNMVKEKLEEGDFSQISSLIPGASDLMNYPAASRRGINWSCSEIYDFHCNNLFDRSKLRGITPIANKRYR